MRAKVSIPRSDREVREVVERAVASTRRPRVEKERAREAPMPELQPVIRTVRRVSDVIVVIVVVNVPGCGGELPRLGAAYAMASLVDECLVVASYQVALACPCRNALRRDCTALPKGLVSPDLLRHSSDSPVQISANSNRRQH